MDYMGNTYQQFPEVELMFKVGERNAHNRNNKSMFKELRADEEKMKEYRRKQELERQKQKAAIIEKSRKRVKELKEVVRKELNELIGIKEVEEKDEEKPKEEIIKPKPPPKYTTEIVKDTNGFDLRRKKVLGRYNSQIRLITFDKACQSPRTPTVVKELFKQNKINQFPIVETLLKEIGTLQLEFFPQFTSVDTTKPLLFYAEPLLMKISSETEVVLAPRPPAITYDNLKFKHILFTTDHLCSCFNKTVIDHSNNNPLMLSNYELPKIIDDDLESFLLRRLVIAQNLKKQDEVIQPFDSKVLKPDPISPREIPKQELNENEFEESEMDKQADELIKQLIEGKNINKIIDEDGNEIECDSLDENENDSEFIKEAKRRAKEKILDTKPNISPDFNQDGTPRTLANTDPKLLKKALEGMLTPVDMSIVKNRNGIGKDENEENEENDQNEENDENGERKTKKKQNTNQNIDFYENMSEDDDDDDEYEYVEVDENGNEIEPVENDENKPPGFRKPPPVHWGEVNESDDIYANIEPEKKVVKRIKRKKINPVVKMESKPKKNFVKNDDSLVSHIAEIDAKVNTHRRTSFVSVKNDKGEMEEATIEFGVINSESFSDGNSENNKEENENNQDIKQMKSIHDNDNNNKLEVKKEEDKPVIQFNPDRYVKQKEKVSIVREYEKRDSKTTKLPNIPLDLNLDNEEKEDEKNNNSQQQQQPFKRIVSKSRPLTRKNSPNKNNKKRPATTEEIPKLRTIDNNPLPTPPPLTSKSSTAPPHIRKVTIKFKNTEESNNKENNSQSPSNNNNNMSKSKSPTIEPLTNEEIDKIKEELELRENQSIRMEYEKKQKVKNRLNGLFETLEMPLQSRLDFIVRYSHEPLQEHLEEVLYSMENIARYIVKRENALENLRKFESKHSDPRRFMGNNKQSGLDFIKEQKKRKTLETKLEYYTDKCFKILTDFAKVSKENITYRGEPYHEKMECDKTSMLYELEDERIEEFRKKMNESNTEPFSNNEKIYLPDIAKYNRLAKSPITLEEYKLLKPPDWKPPGNGSITGPLNSLRAHEPYAPPSSHISFREDSPSPLL